MEVTPAGKLVALKKKPFTIVISFLAPDGVFVSASLSSETQLQTIAGMVADDIKGFSPTQTDELFNKDEKLLISDTSAGFWYYSGKNANNFNSVSAPNGIIICRRNISKLSSTDNQDESILIEQLNGDKIYLSFMKLEWNNDYTSRLEKKRDYYTISFSRSNY